RGHVGVRRGVGRGALRHFRLDAGVRHRRHRLSPESDSARQRRGEISRQRRDRREMVRGVKDAPDQMSGPRTECADPGRSARRDRHAASDVSGARLGGTMNLRFTWIVAAAVLVAGQTGEVARPATSNVMNAQFPAVSDDGRATFRLRAPNAARVQLQPGGSDNGLALQAVDLLKGADGIWTVTTAPAVPGFHYYWFNVDGLQVNDPGSQTFF